MYRALVESVADADMSRLGGLKVLLERVSNSMRYVDYKQAECDCEQLAADILQIYSRQDLETFSFVAIPRGGLIVLGMLSYALDLQPDQLRADFQSCSPLVIVDDCALSGRRFADTLKKTSSEHIVFAHLYSHPQLRENIMIREPRVKHCFAAHDLADHAREFYPDISDYSTWQDRWRKRIGPNCYWLGQPDLIGFSWNEPDHPFWNAVRKQVEDGWRFFPPHRALKNKSKLGLSPKTVTSVDWQVPASVVYGWFDGILWLCCIDSGQIYSLRDVSADIWRCLAVYGDLTSTTNYLVSQYEVDERTLHRDTISFANELHRAGLIEKINASPKF